MAKSVMVVGTASHVGKSIIATALCRILYQEGYRVAPFKAQNMSLNSAVTPSGREIGRAQAAQAQACGILPNEHMNPILLKPTSRTGSQIVLQGRVYRNEYASDYNQETTDVLWNHVVESYEYLALRYDVLVIEGAGSPVEMNLKSRDLANLRTAELADADVIVVADIDRGGVFASVYGTISLMTPEERARVKGVIVNRFRGDPALFADGVKMLEDLTGVPVLGVIPYIEDIGIDEEDGVALSDQLERRRTGSEMLTPSPAAERGLRIAVVQVPHISNFTDIDPLFLEPYVDVQYVDEPAQLADVDAVILPGSKNTIEDLVWLHERGLVQAIHDLQLTNPPAAVFGICGGYQMLGREVQDPDHQETDQDAYPGIGLLASTTLLRSEKRTKLVTGQLNWVFNDIPVQGYEIHMGETIGCTGEPFAILTDQTDGGDSHLDGECSRDGQIVGTYMHGIFHNDDFRTAWLNHIRKAHAMEERSAGLSMEHVRTEAYERLADVVRNHLDMDALCSMLRRNDTV